MEIKALFSPFARDFGKNLDILFGDVDTRPVPQAKRNAMVSLDRQGGRLRKILGANDGARGARQRFEGSVLEAR